MDRTIFSSLLLFLGSAVSPALTRFFDLTPTADPEFDEGLSTYFGAPAHTGGAETFLETLKEEIIPWVETRYPTSSERGLGGYSLGGHTPY